MTLVRCLNAVGSGLTRQSCHPAPAPSPWIRFV